MSTKAIRYRTLYLGSLLAQHLLWRRLILAIFPQCAYRQPGTTASRPRGCVLDVPRYYTFLARNEALSALPTPLVSSDGVLQLD